MIRPYRTHFSTNVERVALAIAHKGLAVESVLIEYSDRSLVEQVSGQGLVPVIDDDGRMVADSTRILRYLEERYPEPPLFPHDAAPPCGARPVPRVVRQVWKGPPNEIESELRRPAPDGGRIEVLAGRMAEWLALYERMLTDRDYLMGEFSAADCAAFPFLKYARSRKPGDEELFHVVLDRHLQLDARHGRLAAWIDRVDERPRAY